MDRANAVARALVRMGVPASEVSVAARADNEPVYYEFMPAGEAGNRRAEIYLDY
jgi:flagellar motor protein MotB